MCRERQGWFELATAREERSEKDRASKRAEARQRERRARQGNTGRPPGGEPIARMGCNPGGDQVGGGHQNFKNVRGPLSRGG